MGSDWLTKDSGGKVAKKENKREGSKDKTGEKSCKEIVIEKR
jgi:hypothetical protein